MITHWEISQQRKDPLIKEQYRVAIAFFKQIGLPPFPKSPGESWTDYVLRVTKPSA